VRAWISTLGLECTAVAVALLGAQVAATEATGTAAAQDSTSATAKATASKRDAKSKKANTAKPARLGVTPERQAAVMTFVQRNHPELADLLAHLKSRQPAEYESAVRELFRTSERLAQIQERDPVQYELEVALWTAQSRVQLLTARLMMGTTEELQAALRTAVGEQIDARVDLLRHQRQKTADRLANLDREIRKVEEDREAVVEKQLQVLARAAAEGRPTSIVPKSAAPKISAKSKPSAE
jgi:hypothetical protein